MFPGIGKINPKQMQGMMKQLGILQEEIDAEEVIIKTSDKVLTISNPSVQKITMQRQVSFQVMGEVTESQVEKFSKDDIKLIIEKTSCTEKDARLALEETGDIAEAIMKLSK